MEKFRALWLCARDRTTLDAFVSKSFEGTQCRLVALLLEPSPPGAVNGRKWREVREQRIGRVRLLVSYRR